MVKSSLEMFSAAVKDGVYTGGTTSDTVLAMDCGSYVFNAIGRISSIAALAPLDCFNNIDKMYPLGNITANLEDAGNTEKMLARSTAEDAYEAYALAGKGDIVVTYPENNHVRIITDDVHVERGADGKINADKSYVITCESGSKNVKYYYKNASGEIGYIYADSPTAVQSNPQNELMYGTTMNIGGKYTFSELYKGQYVALTLAAYHTGETEVLNMSFTVPATKTVPVTTAAQTTQAPETTAQAPDDTTGPALAVTGTAFAPPSGDGGNTGLVVALIALLSVLVIVIVLIVFKFRGTKK